MKKFNINRYTIKNNRKQKIAGLYNFFNYYISFEKYINSMKELEKIYPNAYFYIYSH